jgi:predicted dehydrogenase
MDTVALVGVHGHGRRHWMPELDAKQRAGSLRLVALSDVRAPEPDELTELAETPAVFTDHRRMLAEAGPDVVVIVTPPATHLPIATDALRAGCDVLLEKPPLLSTAEHDELAATIAETGRACQVGFQSLGSAALAALCTAIADGELGEVEAVTATGRWVRTDGYYRRSAWAGRRTLGGRPTGDGALTNPFAHAVMNVLALAAATGAGPAPDRLSLELYRARADIEVDDTSFLAAGYATGLRCAIAVTLCAVEHLPPRIVVRGSAGRAELEYTTDRLRLPGGDWTEVPGRVPLLDNLLAHRRDGTPLLAPLAATAGFTRVMEAVTAAPVHPIPESWLTASGTGGDRRLLVSDVDSAVEAAAGSLTGFAGQRLGWATAAPWTLP